MCCAAHGKREGRMEKRREGGKQSLSATPMRDVFFIKNVINDYSLCSIVKGKLFS
jgi:hypothetical protein